MSKYIANIYAILIKKGEKTLKEVPENLRDMVQEILDEEEKSK